MESLPETPSVEAVSQPDNDQASSLGHLVCPAEQEELLQLRPMQLKMLGCIACLSNGERKPMTETSSVIMQCTGHKNPTTRKNVAYFVDQGLLIEEPRTVQKSGRGGSRFQHRLTDKGLQSLPPDWSRCDDVDMMVDPFASLPKSQQQLLRCVSCLTSRGKEALNTDIAYCNDMKPNNIRNPLRKLAENGLLTASLVESGQGKGAKQRLVYAPTKKLIPHIPKVPTTEECALNSKAVPRQIENLTTDQQRTLRCIACIAGRGTFEYGVSKSAVEACSGFDPVMTFRNGHKLADMGLVTLRSRNFLKNKPEAPRTFYKLNEEGEAVAKALPANWECADPENTEVINTTDTVKRCITCIWARQLGTNREPAAIVNMIRQCTGFSNMTTRKALARLAKQGDIEQTTVPRDELRNRNQMMMAFTPLKRLIELQTPETCNLGLYPNVRPEYLKPVAFARLLAYQKRSAVSREDGADFINSKKHHTLLTKEQEMALGAIIQGESTKEERERAVAMFIEHNVQLALWYVSGKTAFEGLFLTFDDRVQEALRGIEEAARHFDPSFDVRFGTYTIFWMKQRIQRAAAAYVGIPAKTFVRIPTTYFKTKDFETLHGRTPTILELALACKIMPRQVISVIEARKSLKKYALSLDHIVSTHQNSGARMFGNSRTLHDIVGFTQDDLGSIETFEAVQKIVPHLADYEKAMLGNILGYNELSQQQITTMFGVTIQAVRVAQRRVNSLLRHPYFNVTASSKKHEWQLDAACATTNNSAVVEQAYTSHNVPPEVAKMCGFCPVRKECFVETLRGDKPVTAGIWAGFNLSELRGYHKRSRS